MKRATLLIVFALIAGLALVASPVSAQGGISGPVGTVFSLGFSGFPANTGLWVYAVEPDGRTDAGCDHMTNFGASANVCGAKSDSAGNFGFSWNSSHAALGEWTWVVQTASGSFKAKASVFVTGRSSPLGGATLFVSSGGAFSGDGYGPNDIVNLWFTLPPGCSGAEFEGLMLLEDDVPGRLDVPAGSVKADASGHIAGSVSFGAADCEGTYSLSARDLATGAGASASFTVTGNSVSATAALSVLNAVNPLVGVIQYAGSGFAAGSAYNCWTTRPDGRVFAAGGGTADGGGNIGGSALAEPDMDVYEGEGFMNSVEPGLWHFTCRSPSNGATGIAAFTIFGLPFDP